MNTSNQLKVVHTKNPFKYLSGLLGVKKSGGLKASKKEVEEHLEEKRLHSNFVKGLQEL